MKKIIKIVVGIIVILFVALLGVGCLAGDDTSSNTDATEVVVTDGPADEDVEVAQEFENALISGQNYIDLMSFSKDGLYEQLTSEYGDGFPKDAAEYAVDNVKVDWNKEALESAETYYYDMHMSKNDVYEQLISEYGEGFTKEQAQYAIDHLED